jgi:hypothetical protein
MPNCGPEVELKRTHQVFDVGCACPPCKGNAPYPYATRPCLSTRVGEHQSGPQMAFTPPRRSLSPLPHSLSYLPRSLPWERERARHDLHCRRPELHAVVFYVTPAPPPLSLTPLASSPSCAAPPRMGSQPLPPSCPLWPLVPCSMAVVMAPCLCPSSCQAAATTTFAAPCRMRSASSPAFSYHRSARRRSCATGSCQRAWPARCRPPQGKPRPPLGAHEPRGAASPSSRLRRASLRLESRTPACLLCKSRPRASGNNSRKNRGLSA